MSAPANAQQRHEATKAKFKRKNEVLELVAKGKRADDLPSKLSPESFCAWSAPSDEVEYISRSTFYSRKYERARNVATSLLKKVKQKRQTKKAKKKDIVGDLKQKLKVVTERANAFANQYTAVSSEVRKLSSQVKQLEGKLARANRDLSQISPLRSVRTSRKGPKS